MLLERNPPFLFLLREITVEVFCGGGLLIFFRGEEMSVADDFNNASSEILWSRLVSESIL
jgi:hypothetical protein